MESTEITTHIYVIDPKASLNVSKEQWYVDKTEKPRVIHHHKYGQACEDTMHTLLSPGEAPVESRNPLT